MLLLLQACQSPVHQAMEENKPLYNDPVSYALDTTLGYSINPLTGDSIKPLTNYAGDTIITGKPFNMEPEAVPEMQIKKSLVNDAGLHVKTIIESNIRKVVSPTVIIADTGFIANLPAKAGHSLAVLRNTKSIIPTGQPYPVTGLSKKLHEPRPVKALPMRSKDNATHDIRYLDASMGIGYSYILSLLEDKNGYLWIGTDGYGLCKYDGVYITTYTHYNGLVSNTINAIEEDQQGNIWLATNAGISVFDGQRFLQFTENEGLPGDNIYMVKKDRQGKIWFTSQRGGISTFDGRNITHYTVNEGLPSNNVLSFFEDSKGNIWFGTSDGLAKFDGKRFMSFNSHIEILKGINAIAEDLKGNIWFGSNYYGLIKFGGRFFTHYTKKNGLADNSIMSMSTDMNDDLWIATRYGGINKFDSEYFTRYSTEEGLSDDRTMSVIQDKQGNIWTGTNGGGINKINDKGFSEPIRMEQLGNSRVRPITIDREGNLWFGTEGAGVYQYDGNTVVKYFGNNFYEMQGFRAAITDRSGNLWFGEAGGNAWYKLYQNGFFRYTSEWLHSGFLSLYEDKQNRIFMGTNANGFAIVDGDTIRHYHQRTGLPVSRVFTTIQDSMSRYWIGTEGAGVLKFDKGKFTVLTQKQGLFGRGVTSIIEDAKGYLWLGTLGAGVCRFDGNCFTYFTKKQGLAFGDVWSLKEDKNGRIWVGTDNGLSVLIPEQDSAMGTTIRYAIQSFFREDGLKSTDFNLNSVCIDNNNRIWWGTGKALVTRNLDLPVEVHTPYSLGISHIEVNDLFLDFRSMTDSATKKISFDTVEPFNNYPDNISLPYDQNHLRFHFSAIDWMAPQNIKYSFRLKGLGSNWSEPLETNMADYRGLRHGDYEFQVKAIGTSQLWTETFSYRFTIRPAWWQTWWFKTIMVVAFVSILLFISRLIYLSRLRKQKTDMEKKMAVQMERQRISSEMHDDIGAGLSGVRLLTEMTRKKMKDENTAEDVEKIYQSVGDISSKMKEVIWSLNTENDNLPNLVSYIQKQVRLWLEHYPCQLIIEANDVIPPVPVLGETRREIFLMVKEAIHNVIKHSAAEKVHLSIQYRHNKFIIMVADNGRGLGAEAKDEAGNGMKNMRHRIEKLNGKLFIKNNEGLSLTFIIPIYQNTI